MSRLCVLSVGFVLGSALALTPPDAAALGQQPKKDEKQADPKTDRKAQPKKGEPKKKEEPKKQADPKPPEPKKEEPKKEEPKGPPVSPPEEEPLPLADGPPSPLELVRGLREQGMPGLALEYLAEVEKKPLAPADKAALPLERAKCQLEEADHEPDESARAALVAEARDGFATFLRENPKHPRAAEASLALARLTALDARAQLARARKVEDEAKERAEATRARPLFLEAAKRFGDAAALIDAQLRRGGLDPALRRALERERFEAELARGVNLYNLADTYVRATAAEKRERDDHLAQARELFAGLARAGEGNRTAWVARAWIAEVEMERDRRAEAEAEFNAVLRSNIPAAEEAKRLVRFFQLRRAFLENLGNLAGLQAAERQARAWLATPGYNPARRPTPEALSTRFYLALNLQLQAENAIRGLKPDPATRQVNLSAATRRQLEEAERLFRQLAQADNDYTDQAARRRVRVVRLLVGDADRPPAEYAAFEFASMAALVQIAKLNDLDQAFGRWEGEDGPFAAAVGFAGFEPVRAAARRIQQNRVIALLERARDLATDKDSPADVADNLIRLVYFYQAAGQPYRAAVLGEHAARRGGGKPAVAGVLALAGYASAASGLPAGAGLEEARKADRARAIRLARFLDEKYPTDPATDRARHRLAGFLMEDGKPVEAYDVLVRVRPGYEGVAGARLLQGAIAFQLLAPADSPLPDDRKPEVFRRTVADLERLPRSAPSADEDEARAYLSARCRLALLYLLQSRADPAAENAAPGHARAQQVAEEVLGQAGSFGSLKDGDRLTLAGQEVVLLAEDVRARAAYVKGRALYDQGKYEEAFGALAGVLADMTRAGPFLTDERKGWLGAEGDPDAAQKNRVASVASGADRVRRDVAVLGLKTRVKQGAVDKAGELLDLLKTFGGGVEANVPVLQQLSAELAAQILALRREGKPDEARALAEGFGKLLDRVAAEPNLPPTVHLFIGQSLTVVGEFGRAAEVLKKIPKPAPADLARPQDQLDDDQRRQVNQYRVAALYLVRAWRQDRKFAEAEALLKEAVGTADKPGWGYTSLDFRKEVAYLHEAKGAAEPDLKKANAEWGLALREWTTLFGIARKRLETPPKGPNGEIDNGQFRRMKNAFFEAFHDHQRCLVRANLQLQKGVPDRLQKTMDDAAKRIVDLEKSYEADINPETRDLYADLLDEVPQLKKAYQAAGGRLFLRQPATNGG